MRICNRLLGNTHNWKMSRLRTTEDSSDGLRNSGCWVIGGAVGNPFISTSERNVYRGGLTDP